MKDISAERVFSFCFIMIILSYLALSYKPIKSVPMRVQEPVKGSVDVVLERPEVTSLMRNTHETVQLTSKEFLCMAKNVYFEAKFEPYIGKLAVANVTYNRLKAGKWGSDVCTVVYKKNQFSWTIFNKNDIPSGPQWMASVDAVRAFSRGVRVIPLESADHYHGNYIARPRWADSMYQVAEIGKHIFYTTE